MGEEVMSVPKPLRKEDGLTPSGFKSNYIDVEVLRGAVEWLKQASNMSRSFEQLKECINCKNKVMTVVFLSKENFKYDLICFECLVDMAFGEVLK